MALTVMALAMCLIPSRARPIVVALASAPCCSTPLTWSILGAERTPTVPDEAMATGLGAQILGQGDAGAELRQLIDASAQVARQDVRL